MGVLNASRKVEVRGEAQPRFDEVLTPAALDFIAALHERHHARRLELLEARELRQRRITAGETLHFLPETRDIRESAWQVAPPAPGLTDRRVEITGPTYPKMAINALNSGASVWLADFEDANTPSWTNMVEGQLLLRDALAGELAFVEPSGKLYTLHERRFLATIVVRPRGWHLHEKHLLVGGEAVSASLFDFGLYFFHCAQRQIDLGSGPYFYLPKMESHLEARLWNDVFVQSQDLLGIPQGTVRATALIETIPAAFEMDEILYELRDHAAGLNAGRWDYLFSLIKTFRSRGKDFSLPDRNSITMTAPMMRAYASLLVRTCHRRAAHAIGGMSAFIPSRRDAAVNDVAMAKVRDDKEREARDGFDGSWVAHPDLVPLCRGVFDDVLGRNPDQRSKLREDVSVDAAQLLDTKSTAGTATDAGLRSNVSVALQYLAAWLQGSGAVAIFNLMEDTATAEICRSQVWQWIHNDVVLESGERVTSELVERLLVDETAKLDQSVDYAAAIALFREVALANDYIEFLTLPAYERMP